MSKVARQVALVAAVAPEVQRHDWDGLRCRPVRPLRRRPAAPCSFQASTAQPSRRHCISPGTSGSSRLPPMKAPAKSVPPDMLHHQMSGFGGPCARTARYPRPAPRRSAASRWCPGRARFDRSPQRAQVDALAFRQLAKNAAPAPKKVTPSRRQSATAWSSRRDQSVAGRIHGGPDGLPSKMQQVVPPSRPATCAVPHDPAGGAVPVEALAQALGCVAAADVVVQAFSARCTPARRRGHGRWVWAGRWCRWSRRSTAGGQTAATTVQTPAFLRISGRCCRP
jgi:hypothetical protein